MWIPDPETGIPTVRKLRRPLGLEGGGAFALTFSCYHGHPFLSRDRTRLWFLDSLDQARQLTGMRLWGYVIMPEHVHLVVYAPGGEAQIPQIRSAIKEPVARKAVAHIRQTSPEWLQRISVKEGGRIRHRFWQPGGGYDDAVQDLDQLEAILDYLHANPVRRQLCLRPTDFEWSSARWYAGHRRAA